MKKWTLLVCFLSFLIVTVGCGTKESWSVQIEHEPEHKDCSFMISIKNGETLVSNLEVVGVFEMARMDHGIIEIPFVEKQSGMYEAQLQLPMPGEWISTLSISNGEHTVEQFITFDVPVTGTHHSHGSHHTLEGAIATINGEGIFEEDIEFYQFINHLQIAMYREADEKEDNNEFWDGQLNQANNLNTLLTQIIRLRAMALLAEEKGHEATAAEVTEEVNKIRQQLSESNVATEMIKQFGEERFWEKQQSQYEMIVLVNKVQQDVIEKKKTENPTADMREVNFFAQKEYEDLLVAQIETLDVKVLIK